MAPSYRTLHHWNQWLAHRDLAKHLLAAESHLLADHLKEHKSVNALLVGVSHQAQLLQTISSQHRFLVTPLILREKKNDCIEADLHELPISTGSVDIVVLPHTLEFVDNPRQILAEASRVVKPEGLLVFIGFNPYSVWGLRKLIAKHHGMPWHGNFLSPYKVRTWLKLVDFKIEKQRAAVYRPPIDHDNIYRKLNFMEYIGKILFPILGSVYIIVARAKVIPLTPIKISWKQKLPSISIPSTLPGNIARSK